MDEVFDRLVDASLPGLYEWRIEGIGVYIGQYTHSTRLRREYGMNIARLVEGRLYRRGKPDGFRPIHHHLALAVGAKTLVTLTFLENQPDKDARNARARHLIRERQIAAQNGGLRVLDSV